MHSLQLLHQPHYQALLCILLTVILTLIGRPATADKVWVICGTVYLLFIAINAVMAFYTPHPWSYFFVSMGMTVLYLVAIGLMASLLIKLLKVEGTEESAAIFLVILLHPIALLGAVFLKWLFMKL